MDKLCAYEIDFVGLKSDVETRHYVADDDFFAAVEGPEIKRGNVDVEVTIRHIAGSYELNIQMTGYVIVPCDRCLGDMQQHIDAESQLKLRMGLESSDDGELITIPQEDGAYNIAWNIYEQIALQIPIRHVHDDEECEVDYFNDSIQDNGESEADEVADEQGVADGPIDPRWEALRKLKDNNNN